MLPSTRWWRGRPRFLSAVLAVAAVTAAVAIAPSSAAALNLLKPICKVASLGSGAVGKVCGLVSAPGKLLSAGRKLVTGHVGGAIHEVVTGGSAAASRDTALGAIVVWVLAGAKFALHETAVVLGHSTSPQLGSKWFSTIYGRIGAIAALLTLPFLFAASIHALVRADVALLAHAVFGYLPLALLAVAIAAPLTMLLLAASDQLAAIVASAAGRSSTHVLAVAGAGAVASFFAQAPFIGFLVGLLTAAGALVLWIELLVREAAVYIVVMMLPLTFAAMVWPARRIWAVRAVEVLIALILAKFAIVAVLALGGSALGHATDGITAALAGLMLVVLGCFAPWALLRLLPLTEVASAAAGSIRPHARMPLGVGGPDPVLRGPAADWARTLTSGMRQQADQTQSAEQRGLGAGAESEAARLHDLERDPVGAGAAPGSAPAVAQSGPEARAAAGAGVGEAIGATGVGEAIGARGVGEAIGATGASTAIDATGGGTAIDANRTGLDPMWQAPDFSWRPLTLGAEDWPPGPLWEPEAADDHNPLPPPQDHDTGSL